MEVVDSAQDDLLILCVFHRGLNGRAILGKYRIVVFVDYMQLSAHGISLAWWEASNEVNPLSLIGGLISAITARSQPMLAGACDSDCRYIRQREQHAMRA